MLEWFRRSGYEDPAAFNALNAIHITGTKGKGSTCAFVQGILTEFQKDGVPGLERIGLYTSPHLISVRERIRINGQPLSEEKFTGYFFEVWDKLESSQSDLMRFPEFGTTKKPGYFRFLTLLAFHVFARERVNTAILEVGIGGEYDSTNIVPRPSVCGVTSLGIDHVNVLGNTIDQIAWHKGGIFKDRVPAFTVQQAEIALKVLEERSAERGAPLIVVPVHPEVEQIRLGLPAKIQQINASLAVSLVAQHLKNLKIGNDIDTNRNLPPTFKRGLENTTWPGRCQVVEKQGIKWFIDGAHTKESITEAAKWMASVSSPDSSKILLFNQQTRDANALVSTLFSVLSSHNVRFSQAVFTTNVTWSSGQYSEELTALNTSRDEVDHLVVQKKLAQTWTDLDSQCTAHVFASIESSVEYISGQDGPIQVFVTGSLHLVGGFLTVLQGSD